MKTRLHAITAAIKPCLIAANQKSAATMRRSAIVLVSAIGTISLVLLMSSSRIASAAPPGLVPFWVRAADNPAFQPFHHQVRFDVADNTTGSCGSFPLPANRLLVVEHLSVILNTEQGESGIVDFRLNEGGQTKQQHYVPLHDQGYILGFQRHVASEPVSVYIDSSNSGLTAWVCAAVSDGDASGWMDVSGHLVDVP
jgi:hypothetical protein